ncbi:MAG: hypothetical protein LBT15_04110 [Synergistaceae bacterium]|jgi:hypothetical protein|nr:hypothetical protein [Synergistaceae bacterium]
MEERIGWGEALGTAWGNLTGVNNESSSVRTIRLVFLVVFLGGTGWAVYNYIRTQALLEEKGYFPDTTVTTLDADRARLKSMVEEVSVTSKTRGDSTGLVRSMQDVGRYAFADPTIFRVDERPDERPVITELIPSAPVLEMPPEIVLRAIMIMGKQRVAVMDIVGVGSGLMVKAGDTFMQKRGRVVQIAPDKVVLRWADHNFDIRPNF